ncbi:outer membrane beta-barrel protein [Massilia sp. CCM 8733]|uniref:Outer membrane beta-barrel protein n=1 Tax=Massilia mucilaginosa TaxID=2609282 RepID=A0ABX0NPK2_9BURK|nr:OmpW family outer membrane protein [Massilia mucilaginosa]NHZ88693.1 outer membrane beta-barrel protein [Massilia mucilaginosa]
MKSKLLAAVAVSMLGLVGVEAHAQDGQWLVRARAAHLNPADKSSPVGGVGASDRISVSDKTIPELDVSYFFTPNLAAELVLTYPQKHDVMLDGAKIGTFKHLPPSLLGQYHFNPIGQFKPYLGAGINYTRISKVKLLNGAGDLENDSVGLAFQAGVDFKIDKNWSLNLDLKRINIRSDVMIAGAKVSSVKVDPVLIAVGVGYRF